MKIIIVNKTGNVGKSFITREMIYPNFLSNDKKIVEVETQNSCTEDFGLNTIKLNGNEIKKVNRLILNTNDIVVDVGSSEAKEFFTELLMTDRDRLLDEIDMILVPVTPVSKIKKDTKALFEIIKDMEIDVPVHPIFNSVKNISSFDVLIEDIEELGFDVLKDEKNHPKLVIPYFNALEDIEDDDFLLQDLIDSKKDFKALSKEAYKAGNEERADEYADLYLAQSQAPVIKDTLAKIYALLSVS